MGGILSGAEERMREREREHLTYFVNSLEDGADLRVGKSIKMFTGLSASDNLRQHCEKRKMEAADLVEKPGSFTSSPELAGVGAPALAVFIDIVSFSPPEEKTKEALRCVFAEEKASEVWDQIHECLKREQARAGERREAHRVPAERRHHSMLRDGHMSSQALKAWVNGAAFHIQVLIHLVRLGGIQTCDPVEGLLSAYLSDLETLFTSHEKVIKDKCSFRATAVHMAPVAQFLVDEESKWNPMSPYGRHEEHLEAYYDRRYGRQKREIQQYFSDVREKLQHLVHQRGSFKVS
uniref:uncharacterized protein LOC124072823 n=1 Tax=Scatophagus argus TaxID=75038 RepID=UPI001ED7EA5D|nr:uncharacterized protein LOC124072823 [Scatophagus argus]